MKKYFLVTLLFILSSTAFASTKHIIEYDENLSPKEQMILEHYLNDDAIETIQDLRRDGYKVTVTIVTDRKKSRKGERCEVTIKRDMSGGLGVSGAGAGIKGGGRVKEEVTVKAPCDRIAKAIKDTREGMGWK